MQYQPHNLTLYMHSQFTISLRDLTVICVNIGYVVNVQRARGLDYNT